MDTGVCIKADKVTKVYSKIKAVDSVTLEIVKGEVFGVLGRNGAGKTTLLEMMVGLRKPTSGFLEVLGLDPERNRNELVKKIGVQPQEASLFSRITVEETLALFASFHARPLPLDDVLDMVGLADRRKPQVRHLSGGQQQRLLIAIALIANPEILFLDEPTASLDPQARRNLWEVIETQRRLGRTILLTTHNMEEAERLCDRLLILDRGKVVASGSPRDLIEKHHPTRVVRGETLSFIDPQRLMSIPGVIVANVEQRNLRFEFVVETDNKDLTLAALLSNTFPTPPENIRIEQASLEDVFLRLTNTEPKSVRDEVS